MNREQFESLSYRLQVPSFDFDMLRQFGFTSADVTTMLYGYDTERRTWHVYIKDGEIHRHVYRLAPDGRVVTLRYDHGAHWVDASDLVPNKRLYPERCNYGFCRVLSSILGSLPFTTWNDWRAEAARGIAVHGAIA